MKGGGTVYPNIGVKIDPRSITSERMPESLKEISGYLWNCYTHLKDYGILTRPDIEREEQFIRELPPYSQTKNALQSSYWFLSDTHIVEFLRTSSTNYKVYALRIIFFEESNSLLNRLELHK